MSILHFLLLLLHMLVVPTVMIHILIIHIHTHIPIIILFLIPVLSATTRIPLLTSNPNMGLVSLELSRAERRDRTGLIRE